MGKGEIFFCPLQTIPWTYFSVASYRSCAAECVSRVEMVEVRNTLENDDILCLLYFLCLAEVSTRHPWIEVFPSTALYCMWGYEPSQRLHFEYMAVYCTVLPRYTELTPNMKTMGSQPAWHSAFKTSPLYSHTGNIFNVCIGLMICSKPWFIYCLVSTRNQRKTIPHGEFLLLSPRTFISLNIWHLIIPGFIYHRTFEKHP